MVAAKSMNVRNNFREWCDKAYEGETIIVSRPKNENVVLISEAAYNELLKAKRNAEYTAMLEASMDQLKAGGFVMKTMEELEGYE